MYSFSGSLARILWNPVFFHLMTPPQPANCVAVMLVPHLLYCPISMVYVWYDMIIYSTKLPLGEDELLLEGHFRQECMIGRFRAVSTVREAQKCSGIAIARNPSDSQHDMTTLHLESNCISFAAKISH